MSRKVDLSLLNRLVSELNAQVSLADKIDGATNHHDQVVELSKAIGIVSAISSEAMLLVGDIAAQAKQPNQTSVSEDLFGSLFGKSKKVS